MQRFYHNHRLGSDNFESSDFADDNDKDGSALQKKFKYGSTIYSVFVSTH